jgi:pimeloyl-ACP methyl ester carboxylesterase
MRTPGIAWMMQRLATHYDVYALDFPGHGESGGDANLSFGHAGQDLACLVEHVRERGYRRVGVVGYSMGAAAAMYAAAQRAPIDAVAAICGPAGPPEPLAGTESWPTAPWRWWVRLMGTRLDGVLRPGPWPIEYVQAVTPVPLLIVHHEMDTLIRRADSEALYAAARAPKDYVSIPGALHAVPAASADAVMAWLERHLSDIDHAPYTESGQEARHVA